MEIEGLIDDFFRQKIDDVKKSRVDRILQTHAPRTQIQDDLWIKYRSWRSDIASKIDTWTWKETHEKCESKFSKNIRERIEPQVQEIENEIRTVIGNGKSVGWSLKRVKVVAEQMRNYGDILTKFTWSIDDERQSLQGALQEMNMENYREWEFRLNKGRLEQVRASNKKLLNKTLLNNKLLNNPFRKEVSQVINVELYKERKLEDHVRSLKEELQPVYASKDQTTWSMRLLEENMMNPYREEWKGYTDHERLQQVRESIKEIERELKQTEVEDNKRRHELSLKLSEDVQWERALEELED